jgi:phosphatidylserine/phosphatidylglycerophosphate/cardiolipin synthase-like enzyme
VKIRIISILVVMSSLALTAAGCSSKGSHGASAQTVHVHGTKAPGGTTTATSDVPTSTSTAPAAKPAAPASAGLSLLVEPQAGMQPIYNFMSSAEHTLDMTMYELSDPSAEQILIEDHDRGVRVRVLLDHSYDGGSVNQPAFSTLSSAGVSVAWANDSEIFHQKTTTVDGDESAIMTGNLTSQYYATTRDFTIMDGQATDVAAIEANFNTDWSGASPAPGPPAVDLVWSPGSEPQLAALINSASRSVTVENEEMDSTSIENALESDASRGIDVTVVMTADSEWDSALSQLEADGVHVVLYPDTSSALYIHAKVIDVDDAKAFVGSENFSTASLDYNRELGVITTATTVLGPLNSTLSSDISDGQLQQSTSQPPPTAPAAAPPPTSAPTAGCSPIDDEGGCYEPGEYCRDDDHGTTGRAGNGGTITCKDESGTWYWEST